MKTFVVYKLAFQGALTADTFFDKYDAQKAVDQIESEKGLQFSVAPILCAEEDGCIFVLSAEVFK